jgi:DNA-binding CsgD family transcriptional regulator
LNATFDMTDFVEGLDVAAMLEIAFEVGVSDGPPRAKRRHLLQRLSALVNADAWLWALAPCGARDEPAEGVSELQYDGLATSESALAVVARHGLVLDRRCLLRPPPSGAEVRVDPELDPARRVEVAVGCGPGATGSLVGLYRTSDKPGFSERDRRTAQLLLEGLPSLHRPVRGQEERAAPTLRLSPRQRSVLEGLLEGLSVKEVAASLGLSVHTVNDHRKELYRLLGVRSRVMLLRLFSAGEMILPDRMR